MRLQMLIVSIAGMLGGVVGAYPFDSQFLNAIGAFFFVANGFWVVHWLRS